MACKIEKDWTTNSGLRAVVLIVLRDDGTRRHRCGYVGLPVGHPLHGVEYGDQADCLTRDLVDAAKIGKKSPILAFTAGCGSDADGLVRRSPDVAFDVHGGLTYSGGSNDYPAINDGLWWFGFDCAHCDDGEIDYDDRFGFPPRGGVIRSLEYVTEECESLAEQIVTVFKESPCNS